MFLEPDEIWGLTPQSQKLLLGSCALCVLKGAFPVTVNVHQHIHIQIHVYTFIHL